MRAMGGGFTLTAQEENKAMLRSHWGTLSLCMLASMVLHILFAFGVGWYIDSRTLNVDLAIDWSDEALTGFGMGIFAPAPQAIHDEFEQDDEVEAEDPFARAKPAPKLANALKNVVPPPAPKPVEPKPAEVATAVEASSEEDESDVGYSLSQDAEGLARVKGDMGSMPALKSIAPGNAKLIVLIRTERLKGTRFEASVRSLLKAFPDYQVTLGLSDIDPIDNIDAFLMATNNPELYANTFLAVSHRIKPAQLRAAIDASFPTPLRWEQHKGKPLAVPDESLGPYAAGSGIYQRSLYLPSENLVLFLRPEVIDSLGNAVLQPSSQDDAVDDEVKTRTFLDELETLGELDSESQPVMLLRVQDIVQLSFGARFPKFVPPSAIEATVSGEDNPSVNMLMNFGSSAEAENFNELWPDIVAAAGAMRIPGLVGILSSMNLAQEDERIYVSGKINGTTLGLILLFATRSLPKVRE